MHFEAIPNQAIIKILKEKFIAKIKEISRKYISVPNQEKRQSFVSRGSGIKLSKWLMEGSRKCLSTQTLVFKPHFYL